VVAISKAVTFLDIVTCLSAPVTHLAVVVAPCVDGPIANGDLGSATSLAFEVRGLMHVVVDAMTDMGYGVSSGKTVRTSVHGQTFGLERFFQSSDAVGDLAGLRVVSAEVLDFTLQCGVVLGL